MSGNIWDNFSSQSYKELPSVGKMLWYHPYTGEARSLEMPAAAVVIRGRRRSSASGPPRRSS